MSAEGTQAVLAQEKGFVTAVEEALRRGAEFLLHQQNPQGYWVGELEADTTLESDTVKLWHLVGRVDPVRQERLVRTILRHKRPDGGWPIYREGPSELNATVKAYVALRLAGRPASDPVLKQAAATIRRLGGLERINSFEKVYLALFGLYPWDRVPALPPELVLLPRWFPVNIYEISYWSRTILVPLSVIYAIRPAWVKVPFTLDELWNDPVRKRPQVTNLQPGGWFWRRFFLWVDRCLRWHEAWPYKPLRMRALRMAEQWITQRLLETDGLGAIFPAMVNAVFALKALGYGDGDPLFEQQLKELERLELEDGDGLKVQPCFSPVWDTALAIYVLCRVDPAWRRHPALKKAVDWLLKMEVRVWGDWQVKNPHGRPGGWAFEFRNPFYPDVDDTAQVLLALVSYFGADRAKRMGAFQRGLDWILSMQNRDGGWSSFDKDNDCLPLTHFPFADHNAMLDPSACDITGRVLELLHCAGYDRKDPVVRKAVDFLHRKQEPDGPWFGRWGVNYIYGTWLVLRGLAAVGESMGHPRYQKAGDWLIGHQNPDGGWGESCLSYDDPSTKGVGRSTPSQTAWALMTLATLGRTHETAFRNGVRFLLKNQSEDGDWAEDLFTGTGFPRVFYLRYHLYRTYFPLLALAQSRSLAMGG
jgi:squalene-hopene/tetraprenyl-beta-curcumene cyclase